MNQSLIFDDSIELIDDQGVASGGPYSFSALGEGTSWGETVPIEVVLNSLLRDGQLVQTDGAGNREAFVRVEVRSTDPIGLAEGIAHLHRATGKRTTLRWLPPGMDVRTVFEVETSDLQNPGDFADLDFLKNKQIYTLRLVCLPFTRSESLTTEVAEGIPSIGTTVNNCESLTGWSTPATTISPAPTMLTVDSSDFVEGSGAMSVGAFSGFGLSGGQSARSAYEHRASLAQSISMPAGGYLSFAVKFETSFDSIYTTPSGPAVERSHLRYFRITSTEAGDQFWRDVPTGAFYSDHLLSEAIVQSLANGWTRYTIRVDRALTITSLGFDGMQLRPATFAPPHPRMKVDHIAVASSAALGAQVLKTIEVGGSARTTGALHVAAPSDAVPLRQVLAFTIPQTKVPLGFRPDMRRWLKAGVPTTADADAIGGSYFTSVGDELNDPGNPVFVAPASTFAPGASSIVVRFRGAQAGSTFGIQATLMIGTTEVASEDLDFTMPTSFSGFQMVPVGTMYLPPVAIQSPSTDATIRFRFRGSSDPEFDEMYALPVGGDTTIIDCGASSHVWIDSPSPEQPQGGYWKGGTPTRSNALSAWSTTTVPGIHSFEPVPMLAFVASTSAQGPTVSFDYYKRWLAHAPE